jgi:anti-anti-sigma factor
MAAVLSSHVKACTVTTPLLVDSWHTSGALVVNAVGEIDATNASRFEDYVTRVREFGVPMVLDFAGVSFMDASGLHVLVRLDTDQRVAGTSLRLVAVRGTVARLMEITGMREVLHTHATVAEALAAEAGTAGQRGASA